jgi:hypothetical protein
LLEIRILISWIKIIQPCISLSGRQSSEPDNIGKDLREATKAVISAIKYQLPCPGIKGHRLTVIEHLIAPFKQ